MLPARTRTRAPASRRRLAGTRQPAYATGNGMQLPVTQSATPSGLPAVYLIVTGSSSLTGPGRLERVSFSAVIFELISAPPWKFQSSPSRRRPACVSGWLGHDCGGPTSSFPGFPDQHQVKLILYSPRQPHTGRPGPRAELKPNDSEFADEY